MPQSVSSAWRRLPRSFPSTHHLPPQLYLATTLLFEAYRLPSCINHRCRGQQDGERQRQSKYQFSMEVVVYSRYYFPTN